MLKKVIIAVNAFFLWVFLWYRHNVAYLCRQPHKWLPVRKDAGIFEIYHHYLDRYVTVKFTEVDIKTGRPIYNNQGKLKFAWINCVKIPKEVDPTGISNTEFYWSADKVPTEWKEFLLKTPEAHQYF